MHDNLDGTVTGHFTVPTLAGAILRKMIQQMVSPRRHASTGGREGAVCGRRECDVALGSGGHGPRVAEVGDDTRADCGVRPSVPARRLTTAASSIADPAARDRRGRLARSTTLARRVPRSRPRASSVSDRNVTGRTSTAPRSSSCSSTYPPTGSAARSPPPSWSPSTTTSCANSSALPTSTPATTCPPPRPDAWPVPPASCPRSSTAARYRSTSDAPNASSPKPNASPWPPPTTSALPSTVTAPTRGPTCTTKTRGPEAVPRTCTSVCRCAAPTTSRAHDARYEHVITTDASGRKTVTFHLRT